MMPRNPRFPLTPEQRRTATVVRNKIVDIAASAAVRRSGPPSIEIEFTKRDGSRRILSGRIEEIAGTGSSEHVKIVTDNGIRSANLWSINYVGKM